MSGKQFEPRLEELSYDPARPPNGWEIVPWSDSSNGVDTLQQREKSIDQIITLLMKYWQLVAASTIVCIALAAIYLATATRLYTATATLKIGNFTSPLPTSGEEDSKQLSIEENYRQTQAALLTSYTLADYVLSKNNLADQAKAYFAPPDGLKEKLKFWKRARTRFAEGAPDAHYNHPAELLRKYLRLIGISPVKETALVKVSATTSNPVFSQTIANAHSEAFMELLRDERQRRILEDLRFLEQQADELRVKVIDSERKLADYANENELYSSNKDGNLALQQLTALTSMHAQAVEERIKSETLLRETEKTGYPKSTALDDDSIRDLRVALKEAESEYFRLSEKYTGAYPAVAQLKAKISALSKTITEQRYNAWKGLEAIYKGKLGTEKALQKQIEQQRERTNETSQRYVQYNILQREYDSLKDLHQTVLRQLKQSQISAASLATNVSVTEHAIVPRDPSSPRTIPLVVLSIGVGIAVGAAIAMIKEALDNTLKTPEDVHKILRTPSLGVVPALDGLKNISLKRGRLKLPFFGGEMPAGGKGRYFGNSVSNAKDFVTVSLPTSMAAEAFRTVRTSILLSSPEKPPQVVMVTSSKKGEGKTTLASNLAVTLAQASWPTVLIDTDIRQPQVRRHFSIDHGLGLVDYLAGQASLSNVIVPTEIDNLWVIPAGSRAPNPAELIGSAKMEEFLDTLRKRFKHILLDTPPVLSVADSLVLSQVVDGVVMVVRSNETERAFAEEALRRLKSVRAPILGAVVNDFDTSTFAADRYRQMYEDPYWVPDETEIAQAGGM